ncbi:MAG: hypothetical protein KKB51_19005, partial [Candidatus Riflebacteria bacterium]|nr:hypothetical protein [Candidatus Riflebacteria bacterium]
MVLLVASMGCIFLAGFGALLTRANPKICSVWSAVMAIIAGGLGIIPCLKVLAGGENLLFNIPWEMPFGSFSLHLDPLAAFFLLIIFGLGVFTAVFGSEYLFCSNEETNHGLSWLCFHTLWASMILVILAANGLLFLLAWELTVISSFFLVVMGGNDNKKRHAGWVYLIASHLGAGFLVILFLLLARETGSLDFASFAKAAELPMATRGILFLLAIIGFGTKAGFIPLHVWLPEAHPAAPSHVSALMSGAMIKTGIYGLLRIVFFMGTPDWWWGWTLLIIGLISGFFGVIFAISQNDLKRLLAYSSVENIGIVAIGIGFGLLGLSNQNMLVAVLGFAGGLLHVLNHAIFKGLLFLGSGAVLAQTGTRDINSLGGLLKKMPWTGATFLVGCVSICGLPPFNGFVSEFLIFLAAFYAVLNSATSLTTPGLLIILDLSLIGGLAAACFTKAFAVIFLGTPRTQSASQANEVGSAMKAPMVVLALLCFVIAITSPLLLPMLGRILQVCPLFATGIGFAGIFALAVKPLMTICGCVIILFMLTGLAILLRNRLQRGREIGITVTWGCGYAHPASTMQYTGSSFAQPLTDIFHSVLRTKSHVVGVEGYFPQKATFKSHTNDLFEAKLFSPFFRFVS